MTTTTGSQDIERRGDAGLSPGNGLAGDDQLAPDDLPARDAGPAPDDGLMMSRDVV